MSHMVITAIVTLLYLVASTKTIAELTAKSNDKDDMAWAMDISTFKDKSEKIKKTKKGSAFKSLLSLKKRVLSLEAEKEILQKCYSGDLYQTVKALGVFNIPGVSMINVSGDLFNKLIVNNTIKMKMSTFETTFKGNYLSMDGSNGYEYKRRQTVKKSVSELSKRGTDICEESAGVLIQLAHASGQLAYQVYDYDCSGSTCSVFSAQIGNCKQKIQTIVLYIIDEYGDFVPSTEQIGCGCECILY